MIGKIIAILSVLAFVISNVLFKKTEKEASPTFINLFRTFIGTLSFIIISIALDIFLQIFLLPWDLWVILILSFLFGQVIGDTSYFKAQKHLGTTNALAISMTFPIFTFILSIIFLNRPFKWNMVFSLIFIGIGVILVGKNKFKVYDKTESDKKEDNKITIKAIILGFLASLGWAIGIVLIDYAISRIDYILNSGILSSIIGNVIRFPFAVLILFLLYSWENIKQEKYDKPKYQKKTLKIWSWLIIASLIGTSIGSFLYTEGAYSAGAEFMSLIYCSSPLFAIPFAYFLNKEKISKKGFLGVLLIIIGVILILI